MKYEVTNTVLQSTLPAIDPETKKVQYGQSVTFKEGEIVTPEQLTEAGFDVDFLVKNGSIEALRGTDDSSGTTTVTRATVKK